MTSTRILATCALGLGFSYKGFQAGLERGPDVIACDAGSSDYGPFYLGSGKLQKAESAIEAEYTTLLKGAHKLGVPFVTGSVGGAGDDPQVAQMAAFTRRVADQNGLGFRMAEIRAHISPAFLERKIRRDEIAPLGGSEALTEKIVHNLSAAVGQMGSEPFLRALHAKANLVLAGRATDPAIFACVPLHRGKSAATAWHAAKCVDKGYLATTRPRDGSPVLATISDEDFTVEPTREGSVCTVSSVSGMVVYENHDPFRIAQPEGVIDTTDAVYTQDNATTVRVTGSRFVSSPAPTVKIEGAAVAGYRAAVMAGIRDPRLIADLDAFLVLYRETFSRVARSLRVAEEQYRLQFRVYGRDAVMGAYEPKRGAVGHEVGLLIDLIAQTPELLAQLSARLAATGSRLGMDEGAVGGGNFAFPFSPAVIQIGAVYEWSIWHIARLADHEMAEIFPITLSEIGREAL
jgi:hypothetical protein